MSIHSLVTPGVFDPEALASIDEVFDAVCKALHDTGQPEMVLEIIAQRIIEAARHGERDPARLVEVALPCLLANETSRAPELRPKDFGR
jgi:hypothetical protein